MTYDLSHQSRKRARAKEEPRVRLLFLALSVAICLFGVYLATENGQPLFDSVVGATLATVLVYHICVAFTFSADDFLDQVQPKYMGDRPPEVQLYNPPYYYHRVVDVPTRPPRSSLA